MLFGRRTWQAFITAWGRTPIVGKIPVQLLADLPVARPFGGQQRDLQFLRASRFSTCGERLAAALGGARKAAAI
jgi:hypothetical protein